MVGALYNFKKQTNVGPLFKEIIRLMKNQNKPVVFTQHYALGSPYFEGTHGNSVMLQNMKCMRNMNFNGFNGIKA